MPADSPPWSKVIQLSRVPAGGATMRIVPTQAERAALAKHINLLDLPDLAAEVVVLPDGKGGAEVTGRLEGRVVQACVVSLEPVGNPISEPIEVRFLPIGVIPSPAPGAEIDLGQEPAEPPEPVVDGKFDLGAVLTELLTVAIDPYPRKTGVAFEAPADEGAAASPFAALAKLKGPSSP